MQCERIRRELPAFVRGDLPPRERAEIEDHLSTCPLCTEEAVAMKGLGETIQHGLKQWVDAGECPPAVVARIEVHIRSAVRRPWWRTWQSSAGLVAAAAAVFLVLLGARPEYAEQMASVPLLGSLAAQFITPDLNVQVAALSTESVVQQKPRRVIDLDVSGTKDGVILTLQKVEIADAFTRLLYVVRGTTLDKQVAATAYEPQLSGPNGAIRLRSYSATQRKDYIQFAAYFDPIPAGQVLTLSLSGIPVTAAEPVGWTINQDQAETANGHPDALGAVMVAWVRQENRVLATIQWPEGRALHLTGWSATDAGGKSYPLREYGRPVTANGIRIEQLVVDVPPGIHRLTLTAGQVVRHAPGSWQVSFSN